MVHDSETAEYVTEYKDLGADIQQLIDAAIEARENAYVPMSNFKVGSAILTKCGKTFTGCNIENGAQTSTVCAERVAYFKAVSEGIREFTAVVCVAVQQNFTSPCGVCRQVISEFAPKASDDVKVYMTRADRGSVLVSSLHKLLPHRFVFED